jgi:hypothetical protein
VPLELLEEPLLGEALGAAPARRGVEVELRQPAHRRDVGGRRHIVDEQPGRSSRTISADPPARGAITGMPDDCASAMHIPNSSTEAETSA